MKKSKCKRPDIKLNGEPFHVDTLSEADREQLKKIWKEAKPNLDTVCNQMIKNQIVYGTSGYEIKEGNVRSLSIEEIQNLKNEEEE